MALLSPLVPCSGRRILSIGRGFTLNRSIGTVGSKGRQALVNIHKELQPLQPYLDDRPDDKGLALDSAAVEKIIPLESYLSRVYPKLLAYNSTHSRLDVLTALRREAKDADAGCLVVLLVANWQKNADTRIFVIDLLSRWIKSTNYDQAGMLLAKLSKEAFSDNEVLMYCKEIRRYGYELRMDVSVRESLVYFFEQITKQSAKEDFAVRDVLTEVIIRAALREGKPLLAASICLKLRVGRLSCATLNSVVIALSISHKDVEMYHLTALGNLLKKLPRGLITMSSTTKARFLSMGIRSSKGSFSTIANDCYEQLKQVPGDDIPMGLEYKLLSINVHSGMLDRAARMWDSIKGRYDNIVQHDRSVLIKLIFAFSGEERYRAVADEIVNSVPTSYFGIEGLTEALLMYCARKKDYELAKQVYATIEHPIRRTTLTYLLHLHVSLGDANGTEKILKEIKSRGEELKPEELARIVKSLSTIDMEKARLLAERFPIPTTLKSFASIIDTAIQSNDFQTADKYLDRMSKHTSSKNLEINGLFTNLTIKRLCASNDMGAVRKKWQKWLVTQTLPQKEYQVKAFRTLLDEYIRQNNPQNATWVIDEMRASNFPKSQIKRFITQRAAFSNLTPTQKTEWLRLID